MASNEGGVTFKGCRGVATVSWAGFLSVEAARRDEAAIEAIEDERETMYSADRPDKPPAATREEGKRIREGPARLFSRGVGVVVVVVDVVRDRIAMFVLCAWPEDILADASLLRQALQVISS